MPEGEAPLGPGVGELASSLRLPPLTPNPAIASLPDSTTQSVDPSGNPVDVSKRLAGSTQLSASQAAMMRDPTVVLAGWQPPTN